MIISYTRIIMRLLFLFVFIGLNAYSQKINLGDLSGYQNSSLDTLKQEFNVYLDDHMLTIDLNNFEKSITPLTLEKSLPPGTNYLSLPLVWLQNAVYFVQGSGGMMYTIKNDTIKRIDNSFDHGMQYGVRPFEHDGTVFKYGGYGFWSDRDFFTYYDQKQNEWEVYHPIASDVIPEGRSGYHFIKYQNLFHVFGGSSINPNNRREKLNTNDAWTFDFKTDTWDFLGEHEELEEPVLRIPYLSKLLLIYRNHLTVIDIENNSKTDYMHSPISAQVPGIRYVTHAGGKFYVVLGKSTGTFLNIVDEEDFFGDVIKQAKFYKNQGYWFKQGGLYALVMLVIILMFWLVKKNFIKRNKIKLLDNGIRYHLKFIEFDMESMAILKLLLSKPHVASSQILKIVEKEQYSPAHNERLKVQKINDINLKVSTLLRNNEPIITNFKAENDRRIRVYRIRKDLFN